MSLSVFSQEIVTGLQINEAVAFEAEKIVAEYKSCNCGSEIQTEAMQLPFFDDFSTSNIYPNQELWDGRSTYVNKYFPLMPTNIGVVTLDAINSSGRLYGTATVAPFVADTLMTQGIRLDSIFSPVERRLSPADSVYLSFYYQPQGVGFYPELRDSLILEFSHYTGNLVFSHIDSITVSAEVYIGPGDTIHPLDVLWPPVSMGCNPDISTVVYEIITFDDSVTIACDSIFIPEVVWDKVWYSEGLSLEDFRIEFQLEDDRDMVQIMIPILDTAYFNDRFRFRFRNYASLSNQNYPNTWQSNDDTWNIDYVYLNYNRSEADTTYRALSFSQSAPSFLKNYQVMPYRQYRSSPTNNTSPNIRMYITNLDNIEHNTKYSYHVKQVAGDFAYDYFGGSCNLKPFYEVGFQVCDGCGAAHACPPVVSVFSLDFDMDTTSYIIKHYISDSSDQNSIVDSAIYHQGFYNYFAYDDGTPEMGWGVDGYESAQVAYKFTLNVSDTLWGVQMYFNRTLDNANESFFDLLVWSDNNGSPGEIIHRLENQKVKWENGLYHFYPYMLDEPVLLAGTFYVGWERRGQNMLNIGFDANNDVRNKIFHLENNGWLNATHAGALLVRPIVGANMILSTEELLDKSRIDKITLFPNPTSTHFSILHKELKNNYNADLKIFNIFGVEVHSQKGINSNIDISHLSRGIYIVRVVSENKQYISKLLINR